MNLPPLNYLANLVTHRRRAAALVLLAVLAGLLFLLPRPSLTAGTEEPQQTRRRGASAVAKGSKRLFIHDKNHIRSSKENGRLVSNCAECHRIPGAFYVSENAQGFNVREFPDHPDCLRCHEHRKDFFKGATPPICTVCHKGSSPREGNPGLFPKAGGPDVERDFTGRFPHDKHQDILAVNDSPARANSGFRIVKAGFSAQDNKAKAPTRWDCRRCHLPYPTEVEKQLLANVDWAGAKLPLFADDQKKLYTDSDKKVPLLSNINLPIGMKPDETALYDLAMDLYRDRKVSDASFKAAKTAFGERGIMDVIGIIGYYDLVSMTLITMEAQPPNDSVAPLPPLVK